MYTSDYPSSDHPSQACSQNVFKFWKPRGFQPHSRSFFESGPMDKQGRPDSPDWVIFAGLKIQVQIQKTLSYVFITWKLFLTAVVTVVGMVLG